MQASHGRLAKLEAVLEAQRRFIHSVPDPDTRERAEQHLCRLVEMREEAMSVRVDAVEHVPASMPAA